MGRLGLDVELANPPRPITISMRWHPGGPIIVFTLPHAPESDNI